MYTSPKRYIRQKLTCIGSWSFFCADEMPENWLDAAYDAIANAIDIESFEQKINNALRNVYAWDLGEVVLID
jgi:hypothetical protein